MNIHIVCDSPKTMSGFANVGRHLALQLMMLDHNVSITGLQTHYKTEIEEIPEGDIEVMPCNVQYIDDITQILLNIQKTRSDIVICIFNADDSQQNQIAVQASSIAKTCWYVPVEGKNISDMMARDLLTVSQNGRIVAQCNWGHDEMLKKGIESTVIYHGYDPEIFKKEDYFDECPCEIINLMKYDEKISRWTAKNVDIRDLKLQFRGKFVFGFVGANHGIRKRIERLLTSYFLFLRDNKKRQNETLLVLRTMPISVTSPANLIKISNRLGISNNVIFLYGENNRLSDSAMNIIYNRFDVNVSASSSEGFGLPTLETMAIGVPQIGPACSSFIELISNYGKAGGDGNITDRGLLVYKGEWQMINDGSERFLINEKDFADKMETMYIGNKIRESCGKTASEWSKQYTWEKVAKQWDRLIHEI